MRTPARHWPRENQPHHGFTLIEVLVALTILSIALTILLGIFGQSLARNRETAARMAARDLVSALLAKAQTSPSLKYSDSVGTAPPHLQWTLAIRPFGSDDDRKAWPGRPARITATVAWGSSGQLLSLSTVHILPKASAP